jgi:transposase
LAFFLESKKMALQAFLWIVDVVPISRRELFPSRERPMRDAELYAKILGLPHPWFVENVDLDMTALKVLVQIGRRDDTSLACPERGQACPGYDRQPRRWRHLDTCQFETVLAADVPRCSCPEHGVKQVRVPWAGPCSRITALFERLAIDWMQEAGRSATARQLGLSRSEADGIMQRAVNRGPWMIYSERSLPCSKS